jgi:DNA-binding GntR family transcriptional regulator
MSERPKIAGHQPKLTAKQIRYARRVSAARKKLPSTNELARQYGVGSRSLHLAVNGLTYKWVR